MSTEQPWQSYPAEFALKVKRILDRHPDVDELGFDVASLWYEDETQHRAVRRYIVVDGRRMGLSHSKMPVAGQEFIDLINREATSPPSFVTRPHAHPYWLALVGDYECGLRFSRRGVDLVPAVEGERGREPFDDVDSRDDLY